MEKRVFGVEALSLDTLQRGMVDARVPKRRSSQVGVIEQRAIEFCAVQVEPGEIEASQIRSCERLLLLNQPLDEFLQRPSGPLPQYRSGAVANDLGFCLGHKSRSVVEQNIAGIVASRNRRHIGHPFLSRALNPGSIASMNRHPSNESKVDFWSGHQIAGWAARVFDGSPEEPCLPSGDLSRMIDSCGLAFKELTSLEGKASVGVVFDPLARIDHPGRATVRLSTMLQLVQEHGASPGLEMIAQRVRDDTRRDLNVIREPLGHIEFQYRDQRIVASRLHWVGSARDEWVLPSGGIESQPTDALSAVLLHNAVVAACGLTTDKARFAELARTMEGEGCLLDGISVLVDTEGTSHPKSHFVSPAGNAEELLRSSFEAIGRESARDLALTISALIMSQPDAVIEHAAITMGNLSTVEVCVGLDGIQNQDDALRFALQVCFAFGRPELEDRILPLARQISETDGRLAKLCFELAATGRPQVTFHLRPTAEMSRNS